MKSKSKSKRSSISSTKKGNSEPYDNVLALGCQLVTQLGLDDTTDTLARWMAHYIAELIKRAEEASGEGKEAARKECFEAILMLWRQRSAFPDSKRPFEGLELVTRAVESLDPENNTPRYFRAARRQKGGSPETAEQARWLEIVEGLDYSAKLLIGYCLTQAAKAAAGEAKVWTEAAASIDDDGDIPEILVRFVSSCADSNDKVDPDAAMRSLLTDRTKRLRGFIGLASSVADELAARLEALPSIEGVESDEKRLFVSERPELPDGLPEK